MDGPPRLVERPIRVGHAKDDRVAAEGKGNLNCRKAARRYSPARSPMNCESVVPQAMHQALRSV